MLFILTGLAAGILHVFSGPDHVVAVAPLALEGGRRAGLAGFRWGLGHSGGVLLVGLLALAGREALPISRISAGAEWMVGLVLVGIGAWGIRRALTGHIHAHAHTHGGEPHLHFHVHGAGSGHEPRMGTPADGSRAVVPRHAHSHAAFFVGTLHGAAGTSHLLGVLPSLALPTRTEAVGYLCCYGLGTVLAMTLFAVVLGWVARVRQFQGARAYRSLMMACSLAALGVGTAWLLL